MRPACWLMQRVGVDEGLIGDLVEAHDAGRPLLWFWRQALTAIITRVWYVARTHKVLALRAVALGWLLKWLLASPTTYVANLFGVPTGNWLLRAELPLFRFAWLQWDISEVLVGCVAACAIGWSVGRAHREYAVPLTALFVLTMLILTLPLYWRVGQDLVWARGSLFHRAVATLLYFGVGRPVSMVLGALSVAPPRTAGARA